MQNGVPQQNIQRLQCVQRTLAKVVIEDPKTSLVKQLSSFYWFAIDQHIQFKLLIT